jgi:serine/threonine-protein kinase
LDEFKTQVLLLHSEQSTLDNLSSGFSDRYTVHCATSGSEALNTLVETPINVIITAHDLPGMSGLDALREAKKRSPDTIGILLAGSKTNDIHALVGDEEVFQVVSGSVTGEGLLKLVDSATRQMRLMALAESANDTTANVDEPAEHIIMETSENGSTIISDGTGRLPVLDPKKVSAAASVGSRSVDILVLTQDQEFLETIKDSSRGMHKVYYASTLGQANEAISKHKIGVAVVDAAMVGEKIEQLTQHLRKGSSRLVSIVAGRRDDGEMLMDLINRGKVYRFLLKPVSPGRARLAVEASVKHHLEAPDAAFKLNGISAAAKPAATKPAPPPKPVAKPAPKPVAKPEQKKTPAPKPKPVAAPAPEPRPLASAEKLPVDPPLGSSTDPEGTSPIHDGLGDAFGQDDSSFTETMTGIISSVGKKFSSDKNVTSDPDSPADDGTPVVSSSGSDGSLLRNPKIMGIGAAALVVVAGALFWTMSGSEDATVDAPIEATDTLPVTEAEVDFDPVPAPDSTTDVDALIEEARLARDAGQLFNPAGSNAIELFAAAAAADPANSIVASELDAVVTQTLTLAESAMLESRLDDAEAALQRVELGDPNNLRLPFLNAQLSQAQLRSRLDEARAALREDRFEDASAALSAARNLNVADSSEIDAVATELSTARSEQQVGDVLAKAAARLDSGALLSPSNDNARYYYELVLTNDSQNVAARQGLSVLAGKLAFEARSQIDNGDLKAAEETLVDARALDPRNREVEATVTALANARAEIVAQQRRAENDRQAAAERKAEAERQAAADRQAEADRKAAADRQAEADRIAAAQQSSADKPESVVTTGSQDAGASNADQTEVADTAAASNAAGDSQVPVQIPVSSAAAAEQTPVVQRPVAASSLTRTRYVSPKYPRSAERRNLSGWVDIVFTVAVDGTVSSVEILNSEPGDVFVNAATKAVEKWEFEPVVENGMLVEKQAGVRMMFALE